MKKRSGNLCPVAAALEIIGEKWTLLIVRDLVLHGPRRFQDFKDSLSGISPNTLSDRLKRLEEYGLIARRFYADHPPRATYELTDRGQNLRSIIKSLYQWGESFQKA